MSNLTPPTGGNLLPTSMPGDGDRIAAALRTLDHTPPPGWLWALWVSHLPDTHRHPLAGPRPAGVRLVTLPEGVGGYDTEPPHYGIVPREAWGPYVASLVGPALDGLPTADLMTPPEYHAGLLALMLAEGSTLGGRCPCSRCAPTGLPPELMSHITGAMLAPDTETRVSPAPWVSRMKGAWSALVLEVAVARAEREAYIHALSWRGKVPAGWASAALDPTHAGHAMARLSDTGIAAGVCSIAWDTEHLEDGLPYLLPLEVYAGLAQGFAHPVPACGTDEWREQAREDAVLATAEDSLAGWLEDGLPPWDGPRTRRGGA